VLRMTITKGGSTSLKWDLLSDRDDDFYISPTVISSNSEG